MKKYSGIIFDLGGVVHGLDWSPVVNALLDIKPNLDVNMYKEAFYYDRKNYFDQYATGKINKNEFWAMVAKRLNINVSHIDRLSNTFKGLYSFLDVDLLSFISKLKKEYNLYVLSNSCSEIEERVIHDNRYVYLFDRMFFSHKIGYRKPDIKAYETVSDKLMTNPKQLIFVDNDIKNIKGSEKAGMTGVLYKGLESFRYELYGILK